MANFVSGQKLTAASLNEAINSVAGVQNPSNDYQWTSTPIGRLQSPWSTYTNIKNQNPTPLDIDIAVDPLQTPIVHQQLGKICAVRRVFMNVGQWQGVNFFKPYDIKGTSLQLGKVNEWPFIGIIGFQLHQQTSPLQGDGQPHYSMWSYYGNVPQSDTPAAWTQSQKLWQQDVTRNASKNNWWWTGITLEYISDTILQSKGLGFMNIVCWPVFAEVRFKKADKCKVLLPFLAVSTEIDYFMSSAFFIGQLKQNLMDDIQTYFGNVNMFDFYIDDLYEVHDPALKQVLAAYYFDNKVQSAFYKQQTNYVQFYHDFSAGKMKEFYSDQIDQLVPHALQYVTPTGQHVSMSINSVLDVTDKDGEEIEDIPENMQSLVAMAWDYYNQEPVVSAVTCDWGKLKDTGDPVRAALSGLFNDLSGDVDKRLVWVNAGGAEGTVYFDTCPNFYKHKFDKETPDSQISAIALSSLQKTNWTYTQTIDGVEKTLSATVWNLWDFENLSSRYNAPALTSDEMNDWDLVMRYTHGSNRTRPAEVRYMPLSSVMLSASAAAISGDADTIAAGLSSIQTRELSTGQNVLQLYKFDQPDVETVYLSAQNRYDFVMRDNVDNCVKYANLSGIGGEVTLSGTDNSSHTGSAFKFQAGYASNVVVNVDANGNITIGCYYV